MMSNILIITGASHDGIGKSTIRRFQQENWKVIHLARHACDLAEVINFTVDLSDQKTLSNATPALLVQVVGAQKICLVHNAAQIQEDSVTALPAEQLRKILEINLVVPAILNQLFLPHMLAGSSIIYVGSTLSEIAVPNRASYCISKHGLVGLMRATCEDLAGKNIHTSCVCPGFTNTDMLRMHRSEQEITQIVKSKVAFRRLIEPAEIAELIYFCALNPVINGSVLHSNLGQHS